MAQGIGAHPGRRTLAALTLLSRPPPSLSLSRARTWTLGLSRGRRAARICIGVLRSSLDISAHPAYASERNCAYTFGRIPFFASERRVYKSSIPLAMNVTCFDPIYLPFLHAV